ncbi:MAG: hypothetical protein AMK74_03360, partial [Nitrospira bacterium SM23_35]
MKTFQEVAHADIYTTCRSIVGSERWDRLIREVRSPYEPESLKQILIQAGEQGMPTFLPELARLEYTIHDVRGSDVSGAEDPTEVCMNPTLRLVDLSWKNLLSLLTPESKTVHSEPEPGSELVLVWKDLVERKVRYRVASQSDLLALKITEENIDHEMAAAEGHTPVGLIDSIIDEAVHEGIL